MQLKKVPCRDCKGNTNPNLATSSNKCQKCDGRGDIRTDHILCLTWICHIERICVGRYTKTIPKQEIFTAAGIEVQEWSENCLSVDLIPDRPDLSNLSENASFWLGNIIPGKVKATQHR